MKNIKLFSSLILFSFAIQCKAYNPPTIASSNIQVINDTSSCIIKWHSGNGAVRIVVVSQKPISGHPDTIKLIGGKYCYSNLQFGYGDTLNTEEYICYYGSDSIAYLGNLLSDTTYYIKIFELNSDSFTYYLANVNSTINFKTKLFAITNCNGIIPTNCIDYLDSNNAVSLYYLPQNNLRYRWNINGHDTNFTKDSIYALESGTYKLFVFDKSDTTIYSAKINYNYYPSQPNISATTPTTRCNGERVYLTLNWFDNINSTYEWHFSDGIDDHAFSTSDSISIADMGDCSDYLYYCIAIAKKGGCKSYPSNNITARVIQPFTPQMYQYNLDSEHVFVSDINTCYSIHRRVYSGKDPSDHSSALLYEGSFDGINNQEDSIRITKSGYYYVVDDFNGCSGWSGGYFRYNPMKAGIDENKTFSNLKIIPNPANDKLLLELEFAMQQSFSFELYNAVGQLVKKEKIAPFTCKYSRQISTDELPTGIYELRLQSTQDYIIKKIVIER